MDFSENIYFGSSVENIEEIYAKILNKIPVFNIYCIYYYDNSVLKAEIASSCQMFKNKKDNFKIIGIANGREEAYDLYKEIIKNLIKEGTLI